MTRPRKLCGTPGCRNTQPCPVHTQAAKYAAANRARDAESRSYGEEHWRKTAKAFIRDHPICENCGRPSKVADHEPERRVLIAQGVEDPDDSQFLHALCVSCHNGKTLRQTNERRRRRSRGTPTETKWPEAPQAQGSSGSVY